MAATNTSRTPISGKRLSPKKEKETTSKWSIERIVVVALVLIMFFGTTMSHFHVLKTHNSESEASQSMKGRVSGNSNSNSNAQITDVPHVPDPVDPVELQKIKDRIKELSKSLAGHHQELSRLELDEGKLVEMNQLEKERKRLQLKAKVLRDQQEGGKEGEQKEEDASKSSKLTGSLFGSLAGSITNSFAGSSGKQDKSESKSSSSSSSSGSSSSGSSKRSSKGLILPGASHNKDKPHYILTLSDEEFASTTVADMLKPYGEAEGDKSCPGDFGNKLVNRWREQKKQVCAPPAGGEGGFKKNSGVGIEESIKSSKIDCYLVHQTRHHGNGDNLCWMKDVSVNLALFDQAEITTPVIQTYVSSKHFKQPYVPFPNGFVQVSLEEFQFQF